MLLLLLVHVLGLLQVLWVGQLPGLQELFLGRPTLLRGGVHLGLGLV